MQQLVILGTGGFAREVLTLVSDLNRHAVAVGHPAPYEVLGFVGAVAPDGPVTLSGLPVLGDDDWAWAHLEKDVAFAVGLGAPALRRALGQAYLDQGFRPARLVHPRATVGDDCELGRGAIICAGAVLTTAVAAGDFLLVNLNATVGHDCRLGQAVTVHPGANVSGSVSLGDEVEVGTGAAIVQGLQVSAGIRLGAGAVVTRDLLEPGTYVGVPARRLQG